MAKIKTAILWGQDTLLAQAMEIFLTNGEAWNVIRISADQGIDSLMEQVQRTRPDLMVFCQEKQESHCDPLMKLFREQPELLVLADQPNFRVITISLDHSPMQVYSKHTITIRKASDLLAIIEYGYFLDHPIEKEVEHAEKNN